MSGGPTGYNTRRVALQGNAIGSTDGADLNVLVAGGYDWKSGNLSIGPTASFQFSYVGLDGFTETGSLAPLKCPGQNTESERTALGAKASYQWKVGHITVIPQVTAAWQHEKIAEYLERRGTEENETTAHIADHEEPCAPLSFEDDLPVYLHLKKRSTRLNVGHLQLSPAELLRLALSVHRSLELIVSIPSCKIAVNLASSLFCFAPLSANLSCATCAAKVLVTGL